MFFYFSIYFINLILAPTDSLVIFRILQLLALYTCILNCETRLTSTKLQAPQRYKLAPSIFTYDVGDLINSFGCFSDSPVPNINICSFCCLSSI